MAGLPQELRIRGISTIEEANRFLRDYVREFNRKFAVQAAEPDASAFVPCKRDDLDRVFSIQTERMVNRDNTVRYRNLVLQIDKQQWRSSLEGCRVTVYQHLNGSITIGYGPRQIGVFTSAGQPIGTDQKLCGPASGKGRAPFLKQKQTGHLMC